MATTTTQTTGLEADVLRADDRRFEAMKKGDWAALDAALADDLIYVHSTARQESKAEHIANLRGGKPHYRGIAPRDRRVRVVGGVGIVNGVSGMHGGGGGKGDRLITLAYGLGAGEGNPHQVMRLDILGMDNCFEAARLAGVKRVVYASSVAVSGQQSNFGDRLATEDDPTYGTSQYAMHKIFNEFQAKKYIKNYGMSITGVRPANVTGPDKVRGSVDHVQIMGEPAHGRPVHLPTKGLMRLLIHVET